MSKNAIWGIGALVVVVAVVVGVWYLQQRNQPNQYSSTQTPNGSTANQHTNTNDQGGSMQSEDLVVGTGAEAVTGKSVTVTYVGTFTNGQKFDASADHEQTKNGFTFTLGAGNVIEGWDKGVVGMKVGGKRKLTIPSDMAYGPYDYNGIPGGSTLVFEIELLSVN